MSSGSGASGRNQNLDLFRCRPGRALSIPAWAACCRAVHAGMLWPGDYAVTACFWSLLVTWMLRGLAASWTGMVRVSTPEA